MNRIGLLQSGVWIPQENTDAQPIIDQKIVDLTRGMVQANEDAYREFTRNYASRLHRYLLVFTRGHETTAQELLQQTIIKVARNMRIFYSESELWNWLAVLARNCAIDEERKRARHWSMLLRFWQKREISSEESAETDFSHFVGLELESLAEDERLLLKRKYIDGVSVRELAVEFKTSEKGIESKLSRLRKKLKEAVLKRIKHAKPGEE